MISIVSVNSSSKGNCYLVSDGATILMLECGVRMAGIRQAAGFDMSKICGCLISHEHGDHAKGHKEIVRAGIPLYLSQGTAASLGLEPNFTVRPASTRQQFSVGSWAVLPFDVVHDAQEPLGFLMQSGRNKVLFATDTAYLRYRFAGVTHLMIECNYQLPILRDNVAAGGVSVAQMRRIIKTHFGLEQVIAMLQANDLSSLQEVYLMHLSNANSNAEECKAAVSRVVGRPVYVCAE